MGGGMVAEGQVRRANFLGRLGVRCRIGGNHERRNPRLPGSTASHRPTRMLSRTSSRTAQAATIGASRSPCLMPMPMRRRSIPVRIGSVTVGGVAPIVVQSMTNTDTADIESTTQQIKALALAGYVRLVGTLYTYETAAYGLVVGSW